VSTVPRELFKQVRQIQIRTGRMVSDLLAGAYTSAFKGRGMEFEDVREYQPGDEVRSIDWNVTARMQFPYVKNFREERELTVMLVVDLSRSGDFGSGLKSKRRLLAEIAALLALSAVQNNDRVGLLLFTDRVEKFLPPKKGLSHALRLIRELLAHPPVGRGTDLSGALAYLGRIQKRRGICFVLSDFMTADASQQLTLTAQRHDLISVCITDPKEMEFPKVGLVEIVDLESGRRRLIDTSRREGREKLRHAAQERISKLKQLMDRIGGGFIDLQTNGDHLLALRTCFAQRERGKRR
jgi:uncharacterized protein (DUF58 family)